MNKHKCFLGLAILATLVTTPAQAESVSRKAADLMAQNSNSTDSVDQNTNTQPVKTLASIYKDSDTDSKLSASNYFVAVNTFLAIEKNTVFIPQNRTISQDQIKVAQGLESRVIKLRLSDTGVSVGSVIAWGFAGLIQKRSTDWVRLEINGNQVRVVHTTRTTNAITQFSKWWDHPVRKIAFKPDSCTVDSDCVVVKENGIIELKDISLLTKGEFKIEYLESGEWKYAAFRVPAKEYQ
ncbi:hypothetical protein [Dolichospermum flos-aquae]|uniref:hypothetical protein n=1 Tax=Dolichospermum flosaquae TaxID=1166 RepID=UPI001D1568E7|nr:hypothetical protein [Dolichospermum flos-aquae]